LKWRLSRVRFASSKLWEESIKRICGALLALAALGASSAHAAPPTVTPSPGYDARLQEQRAASATTVYTPAPAPVSSTVSRHRKRTPTH
jgi:hypothetical protein